MPPIEAAEDGIVARRPEPRTLEREPEALDAPQKFGSEDGERHEQEYGPPRSAGKFSAMSIMAEFFVSTDAEAPSYDGERAWPEEDLMESGGIIPFHLEILWAMAQGKDPDAEELALFDYLLEGTGEEWLAKIPDEMVEWLAAATPKEIETIAVPWAATEELGAPPAEMAEFLTRLQTIARRARTTRRSLFLWGSL